MSLRAPPSLPELPLEILDLIIAKADRHQLFTTLRVNRVFYHSSSPRLYRCVYVNVYGEEDPQPASVTDSGVVSDHHWIGATWGMEGAFIVVPSQIPHTTSPSSPLLPKPFTYVTRLCMQRHPPDKCENASPLIMPNLQVLQIQPFDYDPGENINVCSNYWSPFHDHPRAMQTIRNSCPLLVELRPHKVILGGHATGFAGTAAGLWTDEFDFPPPWVDEIVILLGNYNYFGGNTFLSSLPDTLKRVTLVFLTVTSTTTTWARDDSLMSENDIDDPHDFWELLGVILAGEAQCYELVGMETIDEGWMKGSLDEGMADLQGAIVDAAMGQGKSRAEAESVAEGIVLIDMETWENRERWN